MKGRVASAGVAVVLVALMRRGDGSSGGLARCFKHRKESLLREESQDSCRTSRLRLQAAVSALAQRETCSERLLTRRSENRRRPRRPFGWH